MKDKKILIVDDSALMRKVLSDIFEEGGYRNLLEASNGQEALDICEREHPDLILLDVIMPDISGMDVLGKIGKSAKVIVVSAVGQSAMIEEAKKLGALDYVVKPFEKEKVLDKAERHLK